MAQFDEARDLKRGAKIGEYLESWEESRTDSTRLTNHLDGLEEMGK
jgi:hypothetical protein